jgi:hypothetical protein
LEQKFVSVALAMQTLSTEWSQLTPDTVNNHVQDQQNTLSFMVNAVDCNGVAVFNLGAAQVFG